MKKGFEFFLKLYKGGFFPIAYFFLSVQRFCKHQLILWLDLKTYIFL